MGFSLIGYMCAWKAGGRDIGPGARLGSAWLAGGRDIGPGTRVRGVWLLGGRDVDADARSMNGCPLDGWFVYGCTVGDWGVGI
jgi:hypothetical protein